MRRLVLAAMALFFLVTGSLVVWENYHKPRLLILHSYDNDYVWTKEVNEGMQRVLGPSYWLTVRYHYMRTKKFTSADELRRAAIAARRAVDQFHPDVLLAVDDYAQKLVGAHYVNDPRLKIVFAGVNGDIKTYGYDHAANVTGILEGKQYEAVQELVTILRGEGQRPARLAYLSDRALSSDADVAGAAGFNWAPLDYLGAVQVADFAGWQREIAKLSGRIDYLLVSGYRKLPYGPGRHDFVPPAAVMAWTNAHLGVPAIGLNVFNSQDGAMISVGVSPYEQGEVAAGMALALLRGTKKVSELPVREARQYVISMSASALARYRIKVPRIFEAFARATDNYYQ